MRILGTLLVALGALALGYRELANAGVFHLPNADDAVSPFLAGIALTVGLIVLTVSTNDPSESTHP